MLRFGNAHLTSILSIGSFFLIWWAVVRVGLVSPTFLPSPFAIFPAARELLYTGELQADVLMSLARIGAGYATAAMLGVLLGLAMGLDDRVADILEPHFDVARQIPAVAWIPLAIIWFGFGEGTRIFIVFIGAFFPIVINTMAGVRNVDSQVLRAAASLGAGRSAMFWKVSLPAALPSIFTGFTVGLGSAFVNIVAAELAGATTGIGYAMLIAREAFRPDIVILGMVLLMVIGIALTGIMLAIRAHVLAWAVNG
jgi:ABC-type nitrate/sulfonate/bicarbonate transport system permease component